MIHKPPIDDLVEKIGSKYSLCVVASKRARQIMEELLKEKLDTSTKMIVEEKPTQNYAEIINMLKEIDLNILTPLESFQILVDVCQKLK